MRHVPHVSLGISVAAVFTVCFPWPEASAQNQAPLKQEEPTTGSRGSGTPVNFSLGLAEQLIGRDIEQPLATERETFSGILQRLEADRVIERCDWNAMNEQLQRLIDLYGRMVALKGTINSEVDYIGKLKEDIRKFLEDVQNTIRERGLQRKAGDWTGGAGSFSMDAYREAAGHDAEYANRLNERLGRLSQEQQSLADAVRTKLRDVIGEYLRRCCGKSASREGCGDSSRPPGTETAGFSGAPRDVSQPGSGGTLAGPGGTGGTDRTPTTPPPDAGTRPQDAGTPPPTGGRQPGPTPPPTGDRSSGGHTPGQTTGTRPASPTDTAARPPATCCERCPGTDWDRFYFPIPPDTDCQAGDVRRDDLTLGEHGTCANPLTEKPGPSTYGPACCAAKTAQVLYDSARSGDVSSTVGSVLRASCGEDPCGGKAQPKPGTPMRLETSILSTGTDTHGRNWVPENAALKVGKERLKPCHAEPFYATKEAAMNPAPAVFAAISADYADDAKTAEASKGTSCHASDGKTSARRESPQERATKAAALGLLASQAKGQIEGLRATFNVTGRENALRNATLQADIVNEVTQRRERISLPMRFDADAAAQ